MDGRESPDARLFLPISCQRKEKPMATIRYRVIRCPHCNKKLEDRAEVSYLYGSPFRNCTKCGMEYLDTDYHEPAIDGFVQQGDYRMGFVIAAVGLVGALLTQGQPLYFVICVVLAVTGTACGAVILVRQKTGADERQREKLLAESKQRLQNPVYAHKLRAAGYNVPPEY